MKMFYGNVPIKSLNIKHYEMDSNFATVQPSDMQAGKTAVAKGKKVTGTGKCFEFANYGAIYTNVETPVPTVINVVEVVSLDYPVRSLIALSEMQNVDFTTPQIIGNIVIENEDYPLTVVVSDNKFTISCDKTIKLQIFYGKDNYI